MQVAGTCDSSSFCLSHTATATVIVSDVNDVSITRIINSLGVVSDMNDATTSSFDTRGGEDVIIEGNNLGTIAAPSVVVAGETYHTSSSSYTPVVTATYGGTDGRTYVAIGCSVTIRNTINGDGRIVCKTAPGTGTNHRWRVKVDGQESPLSPAATAFVSYAPPTITSVIIPDPGTLATAGGVVFTITGNFFGPPVADCLSQSILGCPSVWYDIGYTTPPHPSTLLATGTSYTGPSTKEIRYHAVQCRVLSHAELTCVSVEGSGTSIKWSMSIGGQDSNFVIHGRHTKPALTRARYKKLANGAGCIAASFNDGIAVAVTNDDECETGCTASVTCKAVVYNAMNKECQHKRISFLSTCGENEDATQDIRAPNIATNGVDYVRLLGTNLGPAGGDMLTLTSTYGPSPKGVEPYASISPCKVIVPHVEIECPTVPGIGHEHRWTVRVGSQSSAWNLNGDMNVTTSYAVPLLKSVTGVGSFEADTAGGEEIILSGYNFGPVTSMYIDVDLEIQARYGPWSATNMYRYNALNCIVITDHTTIRCLTAEGTGKDHGWVLNVGNQDSPKLLANTSYAPPMVITYTGLGSHHAGTKGNEIVIIEGRNFGPKESSLQANGLNQNLSLTQIHLSWMLIFHLIGLQQLDVRCSNHIHFYNVTPVRVLVHHYNGQL